MDARYDTKEWETETSLGRRLFVYNYGMRGTEFGAWDMVKTVVTAHEPGVTERTYLWVRRSAEDEMVQVSIVETAYWQHALEHLKDQLEHCMRPDVPRGEGKAAGIGDVVYGGGGPGSSRAAAVFFSRDRKSVV